MPIGLMLHGFLKIRFCLYAFLPGVKLEGKHGTAKWKTSRDSKSTIDEWDPNQVCDLYDFSSLCLPSETSGY